MTSSPRSWIQAALLATAALCASATAQAETPARSLATSTTPTAAQAPGLQKAMRQPATPALAPGLSVGQQLGLRDTRDPLQIRSSAALVVDSRSGEILHAKNDGAVLPIASLTKLMTALVVLDSRQPLDEMLEITREDIDTLKRTPSRLPVGSRLSRRDLLVLSLMASENRAAAALGRHYPGGTAGFVAAMNQRAQRLGMRHSRFDDATGLSPLNVASARDLARLVQAADAQPLIRDYSTRREHTVRSGKQQLQFGTSNRLVRNGNWSIGLQKTGFTNEAGRCLVMQATVDGRRLTMVFLDSTGKLTRYGDASRVRQWLGQKQQLAASASGET